MCTQVIILSHNPSFLKLLWDKLSPSDRKSLQLARIGEEDTTILEWNIEEALKVQYHADIDVLQKYFSYKDSNPRDVILKIRPIIECYCRTLYPLQFLDCDMLGTVIGKIRAVGSSHPLHKILNDMDELNDFCRRYHHAENPNAVTEPIDDNELNGYVKRTLSLVGVI
jgi:wobble nucleotide-excising tRNase